MQTVAGTLAPPVAPDPPLVVIAASAGGIQALRHVLAGLPEGFPAAVLVVQHLEPKRASRLAEVLGAVSVLPVAEAAGGEPLAGGRVFVAPPGRHMVVGADGRLQLSDAPPVRFSRPAADPLFASAAERCGPCAVAVVLTGLDGDGSAGVRAVKARGGRVLVQDPATAREKGMPRSAIATGVADEVVPLAQIADRIVHAVASTP